MVTWFWMVTGGYPACSSKYGTYWNEHLLCDCLQPGPKWITCWVWQWKRFSMPQAIGRSTAVFPWMRLHPQLLYDWLNTGHWTDTSECWYWLCTFCVWQNIFSSFCLTRWVLLFAWCHSYQSHIGCCLSGLHLIGLFRSCDFNKWD